MKKVLIVGDPNSFWVKSYIEHVFDNKMFDVYVFGEKLTGNLNDGLLNNVTLYPCNLNGKTGLINYIFSYIKAIRKVGRIDCVHIQYVNNRKLIAAFISRMLKSKIIITFWGSDLLRKTNKELLLYKILIGKSDVITVGSKSMQQAFTELLKGNFQFPKIIRFGINAIEEIVSLDGKQVECKEKLDFPKDKVVVAIGYNGSPSQNHIGVISELNKLPVIEKEKIVLSLPITYGLQKEYYDEIEKLLISCGIEYRLMTEYLSSEGIACLAQATDIFIHAQSTDAFSASVQEYLCAGKIVLNPSWIKYSELKENDVFFQEYDNFEDIPSMVSKYINGEVTQGDFERLDNNKSIISGLSSWKVLKSFWIKLYE